MAIEIRGFYYEGLSGDVKPKINISANARFLETDTGREFRWVMQDWMKIPGISDPPSGKCRVVNVYIDPATGRVIVEYDDVPIP